MDLEKGKEIKPPSCNLEITYLSRHNEPSNLDFVNLSSENISLNVPSIDLYDH